MNEPLVPPWPEHDLMRERLSKGLLLESVRANPTADIRIRTDAELEQTLGDAMSHHDPTRDLFVFGYGSLMWNPALDTIGATLARVPGWHRHFCLRMIFGRGSRSEEHTSELHSLRHLVC